MGEFAEGVGSPEFADKVASFSGYENFLDEIRSADVVIDQWQLEKLALTGQMHELSFNSGGCQGAAGRPRIPLLLGRKTAVDAVLSGLPAGLGWRWSRKDRTSRPCRELRCVTNCLTSPRTYHHSLTLPL